jgi:uncharacterized protein YjiS (DUF1127 family)
MIAALAAAEPGKEPHLMFASTMFTSITRTVNAWRRAETVRRELSQLSDRELADIGINRSDIDRIADEEAHGAARALAGAVINAASERRQPLRTRTALRQTQH